MFPALRTIYGNRKYSAHIYTFVVAGAGAGKGGAMNGVILARKTDRKLESIYIAERKEFEKKSVEWDMEMRLALKERRKPDMDLKPEEPQRQTLVSTMMKKQEKRGRVTNFYKLLPILEKMPDTFRYSDFRDEVEKAGFSTNAAKRALKKYVLNGLLSRDDSMYKKTKTLKKRYI